MSDYTREQSLKKTKHKKSQPSPDKTSFDDGSISSLQNFQSDDILNLQRLLGNKATIELTGGIQSSSPPSSHQTKETFKFAQAKPLTGSSDTMAQAVPSNEEDDLQFTPNPIHGQTFTDPPPTNPNVNNTNQSTLHRQPITKHQNTPYPLDPIQSTIQQQPQNGKVQRGFFSSVGNFIGNVAEGVGDMVKGGAEWAFENALKLAGVPAKMVMGFLKKAGGLLSSIIQDPGKFLGNLINGIKQGFTQFVGNIGSHLKEGFLGWLFGTLTGAGIELPNSFDMKSIASLVLQVIGVTAQNIKNRIAKFIGEKNVERVEKAWSMISKFMSNGIGGLWDLLKDHITNLKDIVIGGIKDWVITSIIKNAVLKIASMFNPVSGLISVINMIYNVIKFVMERGKQIASLVQAVVGSVASIASGSISKMAGKIESALSKAIPVAIGFFSRLIGLGGISDKIKSIIKKVQKPVNKAIDKVVSKVSNTVKKMFGKDKDDKKEKKEAPAGSKEEQESAGLDALDKEEKKYMDGDTITKEGAEKVAKTVKDQHPIFTSISVKDGGDRWNYEYSVQREVKQGEKKATTSKYVQKVNGKYILKPAYQKRVRDRFYGKSFRKDIDDQKTKLLSTPYGQGEGKMDPNNPNRYWYKGKFYENSGNTRASWEHIHKVVDHWNQTGRKTDQSTRKDFFNDLSNMELMPLSINSSEGASESDTYNIEVTEEFRGPGE